MDHPLLHLVNARIAEAEEQGAFDNLPGAGKPLPREDDPEGAFFARMLKRNGAVPPVVILLRDIEAKRAELLEEADRDRRRSLIADLAVLEERLARETGRR